MKTKHYFGITIFLLACGLAGFFTGKNKYQKASKAKAAAPVTPPNPTEIQDTDAVFAANLAEQNGGLASSNATGAIAGTFRVVNRNGATEWNTIPSPNSLRLATSQAGHYPLNAILISHGKENVFFNGKAYNVIVTGANKVVLLGDVAPVGVPITGIVK